LINPGIASYTRETTVGAEGCLSINKGIPSFNVRRARSIRVVAYDRAEQEVYLEVFGMGARVVQHEMDHLEGKLVLDFAELIRA
jgi:peptide deformylase